MARRFDNTDSGKGAINREAYLRILNDFAISIIGISSRKDLVWYVAREVVRKMGFVDCVVYLLDRDRGVLVQQAAIGEKNPLADEIINRLEIPVGIGITGHVAETRQPQIVADLRGNDLYLADINEARSEICVPILVEESVLGVIDCEDPRLDFFTEDHLEFLSTVASMMSSKLSQLETVERLEAAECTQRAIYDIASIALGQGRRSDFFREVHRIISRLINAESLFFGIFDSANVSLECPYFVEDGVEIDSARALRNVDTEKLAAVYVARRGKPLLLDRPAFRQHVQRGHFLSLGREPASWMGVPFDLGKGLTGVLVVRSYNDRRRYSEHDLELLQYICRQISTTLSRNQARKALRASEERFRTLAQIAPVGIFETDVEGSCTHVNDRWCEIAGLSRREAMGDGWARAIHEEDREKVFEAWIAASRERVPFSLQYRFQRPDGKVSWVLGQATEKHKTGGAVTGYVGTVTDITELREVEMQLAQAQKMQAVGQLTSGIAHDFNNILLVAMGNLEIAGDDTALSDKSRAALNRSTEALERAAALNEQLLALSSKGMLQPQVIDVGEAVGSMVDLIDRTLGHNIDIEIQYDSDLWPVEVDPSRLENSILNLAINARGAMPEGGHLNIVLSNERIRALRARELGLEAGDYVAVAVEDSGTGMPPEIQSRVFEPFFTTRKKEGGSGLGLSIIYGFVTQSGGAVTLDSEIGRGTRIVLYLPRTQAVPEQAAAPPGALPGLSGARILVVEDDAAVANTAKAVLERHGFEIKVVNSAAKALECIGNGHDADLVLSDIMLGRGLNGYELAVAIRDKRPEMAIIFMSGFAEDRPQSVADVLADIPLIRKPFRAENLVREIGRVLEAARGPGPSRQKAS